MDSEVSQFNLTLTFIMIMGDESYFCKNESIFTKTMLILYVILITVAFYYDYIRLLV